MHTAGRCNLVDRFKSGCRQRDKISSAPRSQANHRTAPQKSTLNNLLLHAQHFFSSTKMATCMTKAFLGAGLAKATPSGRASQVTRAAVEFYGPNR